MPEIYLKTIDDVEIFADWHPIPRNNADGNTTRIDAEKVALLLHQRGRDCSIWEGFRKILETKGWNTLAIDLRGHGKSQGFGKHKDLTFDKFEDYHSMYFDVTAAVEFIKTQAHTSPSPPPQRGGVNRLVLIGSSIGANLALAYAADHFEVHAAVLLSPGLNYYGLRTDDVMVEYHRSLALITAKDDPSYPDAQKLIKEPGAARPNVWYKECDTGGHGVDLCKAHPELMEELAGWIEKQIL